MSEPVQHTVEVVLFEVAGTRYAVDMTQVSRIDRHQAADSVGAPLGTPVVGKRALIFTTHERDRSLAIDVVLGTRTVPVDDLRRLPPAVGPSRYVVGAWLDHDQPVLLIDLHATPSLTAAEAPHA